MLPDPVTILKPKGFAPGGAQGMVKEMVRTGILRVAVLSAVVSGAAAFSAAAATFNGIFTLGGSSFSEPGLVMGTSASSGAFSFDLDTAGQSVTFDLFNIWATEANTGGNNTQTSTLQAAFDFAGIGASGAVTGATRGVSSWWGLIQNASLVWGGPTVLNFGNGGVLSIALSDNTNFSAGFASLSTGPANGATVRATATLVSAPTPAPAPVPLPASGLLLLASLGGAGALLRRGRRAA